MSYSDLAQYLAQRQGLENFSQFATLLTDVFTALEEGNTVIENIITDERTLQEKHLLGNNQTLNAPLISRGQYLWLNRIFQWEKMLAQDIQTRIKQPTTDIPVIDEKTKSSLSSEQYQAVKLALKEHLAIINGGPGTGKTSTVSHIVRAIIEHEPKARIAFAAPTGKAAKRMEEALKQNTLLQPYLSQLPQAQTIHRLLGLNAKHDCLYHRNQLLPVDLLIIDEASMLSLELASALFAACSPSARLILLGDANQLAAVDAGAVLHDLSTHPVLQPFIVTLTKTYRFNKESGIGKLALRLQQNTLQDIRPFLENQSDIIWQPQIKPDIYQQLFHPYKVFIEALKKPHRSPQEYFKLFDQYRILCAGHLGQLGEKKVNLELSHLHLQALQQPLGKEAYHGMPILITANNYDLGLFNGDIGLCLLTEYGTQVFFPEKPHPIPLSAISPFQRTLAYALTVHKSQGSEYPHIALLIDDSNERLLSRELVYTGLTRAKETINIYANEAVLQKAISHFTKRQTGLSELL